MAKRPGDGAETSGNDNPFAEAMPVSAGRGGTGGGGGGQARLTESVLGQLIDAWRSQEQQMARANTEKIGLPLAKFCQRLGVSVPRNLNSFKAALQRKADTMNIGGFTVVFSYAGAEKKTFKPLPTSQMKWRVIKQDTRLESLRLARESREQANGGVDGGEASPPGDADEE